MGLNCVGPVIPVAKSVGRKKALELLFYGDLIKAPEALALGLINRLVPKGELDHEARRWAQMKFIWMNSSMNLTRAAA